MVIFVGFDKTKEETREHHHPQCGGLGNSRFQTTRTPQEDMTPTDQGNMVGMGVTHDMDLDRKEWRRRTRPTPRKIGKRPSR